MCVANSMATWVMRGARPMSEYIFRSHWWQIEPGATLTPALVRDVVHRHTSLTGESVVAVHEHVGAVAPEVAHLEVVGDREGQRLPVVHEREVVRPGGHGVDRVPRVDLVRPQHDVGCDVRSLPIARTTIPRYAVANVARRRVPTVSPVAPCTRDSSCSISANRSRADSVRVRPGLGEQHAPALPFEQGDPGLCSRAA